MPEEVSPTAISAVKPFIKWAGGKGQLLPSLRPLYPFGNNSIERYIEPFIGGGAVLFDILNHHSPKSAVINDINPNLVNVYKTVKENPDDLIEALDNLQNDYIPLSEEERAGMFYDVRKTYNVLTAEPLPIDSNDILRAALFMFLNKTCFNGLYRVNRKGEFNAPHGRYKNPLISNKGTIKAVNQALQDTVILLGDYRATLPYIDEQTFLYLDPPYRPLTKSASFNAYDSSVFDDTAQRELAEFITQADEAGAKILLSNSDPKNSDPDDDFFDDLYSHLTVRRISARRAISSKGDGRGSINEIIVMNYDPAD